MAMKITRPCDLRELGSAYSRWQRSNATSLRGVYGTFSVEKQNAWERCVRIMYEYNGHDLRVIAHNSFTFSAGFEGVDPETGEVMFTYITASKTWYAPITDIEEAMA